MNIKYLLSSLFLAGTTFIAPAQEKRILTLEECKEMALKYNADIQTGKIDIEAARQTRKEAFTKYFPQISAGAAAYKADDDLVKANIPDLTQMGLPIPAMEVGMLERVISLQYLPCNRYLPEDRLLIQTNSQKQLWMLLFYS